MTSQVDAVFRGFLAAIVALPEAERAPALCRLAAVAEASAAGLDDVVEAGEEAFQETLRELQEAGEHAITGHHLGKS
jgi:hypothetical protein